MTAARRSFRWNRQDIVPFQESGSRLDIVRLLARSVMLIERGVTPRLIPRREPWRNGAIEHFNDLQRHHP